MVWETSYLEMILTGALSVSVLAILVDVIMAALENWSIPKGIKMQNKIST